MRAVRRPRFLLDLAEELTWLRDHAGADVAERWFDALIATIHFIEKNPYVGRERKDLKPDGIRSWRVHDFPRWLIFFAVTSQKEIVFYRLRSGTMNLAALKMGA
jgi:plasmid stabilization system protein ParE